MNDFLIRNIDAGSEAGFNRFRSRYDQYEKWSWDIEDSISDGASSIGVQEKAEISNMCRNFCQKSEKMRFLNFTALKKIIEATKNFLVVQNFVLHPVL